MDLLLENLIRWADGRPQGPVIASLKITSLCNLKCVFCCVDYSRKSNPCELKKKELLRIIDEGKALGIKHWRIDGEGEIFVKRQLTMAVLKKIKENNMAASIVTNGTLLDDRLIKKLVEMKLDRISISINGSNSETHDILTGVKGSFNVTMANIRRLNYWKKKKGSIYPELFFVPTLTNVNYKQLPEMMELAAENNCVNFILQSLRVYSGREKRLELSKAQTFELKQYAMRAKRVAEECNIVHNLDIFVKHKLSENSNNMNKVRFKESSKFQARNINNSNRKIERLVCLPCFNPFYTVIINPVGDVNPCYFIRNIKKSIKRNSLESIWFSNEFMRIRKNLLKKVMIDECSDCCVPLFYETLKIRDELVKYLMEETNPSLCSNLFIGRF